MADESHNPQNQQPFSYTDFSLAPNFSMQSFVPNHELFSLQAGMEMLEIPSKHHHHNDHNLMIASEAAAAMSSNSWQQQSNRFIVDDDSSLRCLFPNSESSTSSEKLSLSLCNTQPDYRNFSSDLRDGLFAKPNNMAQHHEESGAYQLKNSVYLGPAQELLNEFCSLGGSSSTSIKQKIIKKANNWEEVGPSSSASPNSWNHQSLYSMDFLELQKRKVRLLSMVEQVDRRYKRYCEQMKAVVSSFEAVAGEGSATVYSTLASKAMSRHFRCLRDGIVSQIQATKKAMGEKDPVAPGTTKGETPRLKVLDQCIRQHKAFQQAGAMESPPWRPQRGLPDRAVTVLRAWLFEHFLHPYPSDVDKHILARQTGLSRSQVSNWFINARVRLWKPMVEEMYLEETKEQDNNQSSQATGDDEDREDKDMRNITHHHPAGQLLLPNPNPSPSSTSQDQKPPPEHLIVESDSLSSIINNRRSGYRANENYGVVDLDFSSYNDCNNNNNNNQNFGSGSVSLTLGLQQHSGGGMSMSSFSPASQQSLYFSREEMEDCQPVQFSILDGEAQNLPYRNLMGSQLLHDLAG